MNQALARFNLLHPGEAEQELLACCGSPRWAAAVATGRPFDGVEALIRHGDRIWWGLSPEDWLEAIAAHPRIGDRSPRARSRSRPWSELEQAEVTGGERRLLQEIAAGSTEYERRFGFLYLICPSGHSPTELLDLLHSRLDNDPERELLIAAEEQHKITRLRLLRLLQGE